MRSDFRTLLYLFVILIREIVIFLNYLIRKCVIVFPSKLILFQLLSKNFCLRIETMCILHVVHRCRPSIIIGRTWDDVRAKVRKQQKFWKAAKVRKQIKMWSARRARWQAWKKFGVDWDFVEHQTRIVDIRHSRQFPSKEKCKIIDADKRVIKKLKV